MFLCIIHLYKIEFKDDVLLALTSCGIQKASVFEGEHLDNVLERDFPLFTGLIRTEQDQAKYAMMISAVIEDTKRAEAFVQMLREADIDVDHEDILQVMVMPLDYYFTSENGT